VQLFGSGDYAMRLWLDPQKIAELDLTANDVVAAVRRQNVQVAAGVINGPPYGTRSQLQLPINVEGRLSDPEQFRQIVIKNEGGVVTRLGDVARVEIDASQYGLRSLLNNDQAVAIPVFQAPGSNAIQISDHVRATMEELKKNFPEGLDYSIVYDPTVFVRDSIKAVIHTLLEAVLLVVLVVILFLQTWRASIIPLLAVPVSIVGTFAAMLAVGFSINNLSLFGLVLAIGIVVDDAIVVVENVERNIEAGLSPRDATLKAMSEVTGPIIAIALVLCAVFVPIAFISGLTGEFYRQFALTIAFSTVISAFNSLTLSPALSALLLKSHDAPKDRLARIMDRTFGGFFKWFNRLFHTGSEKYGNRLGGILVRKSGALLVYGGLLLATCFLFRLVPPGFVPIQDKQYLVSFAQLPQGATLDRTEKVIRQIKAFVKKRHPDVRVEASPAAPAYKGAEPCRATSFTIDRVRSGLRHHVSSQLPPSSAGIAIALAAGDQNGVEEADAEAMRRSGLTHLLSVSGLHIAAVVAFAMLLSLKLLALSERLALRFNLVLVSAGVGAVAGIGYTLLTGAQVPTVRSCVAALLVLAGIALGREAISLRLVASGALIVLLFRPEALAGPSFQMSFAAVTAIVALHSSSWSRRHFQRRDEGFPARLIRGLVATIVTGLVVEFALIPMALFHFHRSGLYGVAANIVAIPLTTFVIMPLEAGALLLDAVDWGRPLWFMCGIAIDALLCIAHTVSAAKGAVAMLPSMPGWAFGLMVVGGLWLCLWQTRLRRLGIAPFFAGAMGAAFAPAPDLLLTGDGRHLAIVGDDGTPERQRLCDLDFGAGAFPDRHDRERCVGIFATQLVDRADNLDSRRQQLAGHAIPSA